MRRDVADDARDRAGLGMNDDALGLGDGGIDAAHFADVNEALLVNIIDYHRYFVGVGGEHQARRTALVQDGDGVAIGVAECFIGKTLDVIEPDALAASFMAGRAWSVYQTFQKLKGFTLHRGGVYRCQPHNQSFR